MTNPMEMTGRTVLVTGASSGIGRDTSCLLSELGAKVILVGRNHARLDQTASQLAGQGHHVEPFDLNLAAEVPDWLRRIAETVGGLDGVVHAAGVSGTLPIKSWSSSVHDRVMQVNVSAGFALARGFRQPNVHKHAASLVFVSSVAGLAGVIGSSIYSASKGAVISLTRSLALELARDGIRVNCVAPGAVQTEMVEETRRFLTPEQMASIAAMHPLGMGQARDVAHAIAFLLADTSRWITGITLVVDGGYMAQ